MQPPCDLRRPGRVGRWTSDCLIQIREILLPHRAISLSSAFFTEISIQSPCGMTFSGARQRFQMACRVFVGSPFLVPYNGCSFSMGIVFKEFSFPGYIYFVIVSFPFSTLEKENPYFWHTEPALSFLLAVFWFGISF